MKTNRRAAADVTPFPLALVTDPASLAPTPEPKAAPAPDPTTFAETLSQLELYRRRDGWTAERQYIFVTALAASGCVSAAAEAADITPRSAYRFRNHPQGTAFAAAWDAALMTAARRLTAVAFERAIMGTPRTVWRNGIPHQETSVPSDRLLMFLMRHLDPQFFARDCDPAQRSAAVTAAQSAYQDSLAGLRDSDVQADLLEGDDFGTPPPHKIEA